MKKILVLTDFSECADKATDTAIKLAKKNDAEILFLHWKTVPFNWVQLSDFDAKMYPDVTKEVRNVTSELNALVNRAADQNVKATHNIAFNDDGDSVLNQIHTHDIDFVVMGSHGASGVKELFIGSNAQKVVRHSDVPVLIVKNALDQFEDQQITYLSDFEPEIFPAFEKMMEFVEAIDARIDLIYINTPDVFEETWEIKERMEEFINRAGNHLAFVEIVDASTFEKGVEIYCDMRDSDIVAMATHGRKGLARVILGSLTEKVVNHLDVSVLSLHV